MTCEKCSAQYPFNSNWLSEGIDYIGDAAQRTILFWDIIRKRGNIYFEGVRGEHRVLVFDSVIISDGRKLKRPVNYALARVVPPEGVKTDPTKRPIVVVDPRAGHGPGIGGSKRDSQIGVALRRGHPVYFIDFVANPIPNQTIADVEAAEVTFLEKVAALHPESEEKPAVIGNCQAGWAVALLSADRPDVTGPLMLNGAPMSYWAGEAGTNPMRVAGGLMGGAWVASFLSDLGNGVFDGAYLVSNFEGLNWANSLWTKQYNVYSKVDTEEERYLNFEKWWNSYFMMDSNEIHFIVDKLFVGNELEQGTLELDKGKTLNLKDIVDPVVIFASHGDDITPPAQALNWIAEVYGSVDEIKHLKKTIVYMLDEKIGHLGIFVSGKIANKQHDKMIRYIDTLDFFPPGLYEMIVEDDEDVEGVTDYKVRYEERTIDDIHAIVGSREIDPHFAVVSAVSDLNDRIYKTFYRPCIRAATTGFTAEIIKQSNPARVSRYLFSDMNPLMSRLENCGRVVKENRRPASPCNIFTGYEKEVSRYVVAGFEALQAMRDGSLSLLYETIYGNPWLERLLVGDPRKADSPAEAKQEMIEAQDRVQDRRYWMSRMEHGGFAEGMIRICLALATADRVLEEAEFRQIRDLMDSHSHLSKLDKAEFKRITREQGRILQIDFDRALDALPKLLPPSEHLAEAVHLAQEIGLAGPEYTPEEIQIIRRINKLLNLNSTKGGPRS
ncbi:DUF3141 domain-containing protein [Thermodesulfobacteriota bacterium]